MSPERCAYNKKKFDLYKYNFMEFDLIIHFDLKYGLRCMRLEFFWEISVALTFMEYMNSSVIKLNISECTLHNSFFCVKMVYVWDFFFKGFTFILFNL